MLFKDLSFLLKTLEKNHKKYGFSEYIEYDIKIFPEIKEENGHRYIITFYITGNNIIVINPHEDLFYLEWIQDYTGCFLSKENKNNLVTNICSRMGVFING